MIPRSPIWLRRGVRLGAPPFAPGFLAAAGGRPRLARAPRCINWFAVAGSVLILAGGCAHYEPQPISPAAEADALDARTLDEPRLQMLVSAGLPDDRPRQDASWGLTNLTLAALYFHPDLDIARANLSVAKAKIITAAQVPNPSVSVSPTYNTTVTVPSPWTVGAMINLLVETFGKREYRTAEARELAEAAREALATASWSVRSRVRTSLLDLWAATQRAALTRQRLDLQNQLVGFLEARLTTGQASALDVTRERINRNQINLALREAERRAAEARVALATAVGVPVRAFDSVRLSFAALDRLPHPSPTVTAGEFRRQALLYRTDVQGLLAEYSAAQSALQLEIANQFPNVTLGPGYSFDQGDNKYTLALSADLPLFNQNQGPVAEAKARRSEVGARFTALQAQIIGAIDAAAVDYRAATRTLATADALLADEQAHLRQVSRSFDAGEADRPTLVTAKLEVAAITLSRFDAVVQQRQAIGALEDSLQRPLFDPTARLFIPQTNPRRAVEPSL